AGFSLLHPTAPTSTSQVPRSAPESSAALTQLLEAQQAICEQADELSQRIDRHDLQWSALAVSLNSLDEASEKSVLQERELKSLRTKCIELERALREQNNEQQNIKDQVEIMQQSGRGGGTASMLALSFAAGGNTLSEMADEKNDSTSTALLAHQLHTE